MNNLEKTTNFKIIGFGEHISSISLETIRGYGFDGVSMIDVNETKVIIPTDDDKMAIILVMGDEVNAAKCARTYYTIKPGC